MSTFEQGSAAIVVQLRTTTAASESARLSLEAAEKGGTELQQPLDDVLRRFPRAFGRPLCFTAVRPLIGDRRLSWISATDHAATSQRYAGLNLLYVPDDADVQGLASYLATDPRIEYAHTPAARHAWSVNGDGDPLAREQWALERCGFARAWHVADLTSVAGTPVAVADTGLEVHHPDLAPIARLVAFGLPHDDSRRHGTAVCGLLGAVRNNGIGIAGGARCTIDLYKVFVGTSHVPECYYEALCAIESSPARVINLSLGGPHFDPTEARLLAACVAAGKVVVAAIGDGGGRGDPRVMYPAALPNIIAVGATNPLDAVSDFSLGGEHLWLCAPGEGLVTTTTGPNAYASVSGTSFAAPLVAAASVLLCQRWPSLDAQTCKDLLRRLVDPIDGQTGWNRWAGYGRLNIGRMADS